MVIRNRMVDADWAKHTCKASTTRACNVQFKRPPCIGAPLQVLSLQDHYKRRRDQPFQVELEDLSPAAFVERFAPVLPSAPPDGIFHVFISYRHGPDSEHTAAFYK